MGSTDLHSLLGAFAAGIALEKSYHQVKSLFKIPVDVSYKLIIHRQSTNKI